MIMTRKLIAAALALASSSSLMAEGYQVNTLSARQGGMAHTGVALKLGAESQLFNPAGMGFMTRTLDISAGISGVMATGYATTGGTRHETSNKVSTPLMASAAFSIYDFLKAGITVYTPYGSSINWSENWPGAVLNQSVDLATYTIQPTIAWRITPRLSVGAGLTIAWGNVDLNKGLVVPSTVDMSLAASGIPYRFGDTTPASVNLTGTASVAAGYNIGVMYDISDRWTAGVSYRSLMKMRVKAGNASVTYANDIARSALSSLDVLNEANFTAEMPMPAVLTIGASYRPLSNLTVALDAQLTFWSSYKTLDIEFLSQQLTPYNQHLVKDYSDAWAFRLGAQYGLTDRFDLRAGFIVDLSPVNTSHYNPETPGMTKLEPTIGFTFRPIPSVAIDLSAVYVAGLGTDQARCSYTDLLAQRLGLPSEREFTADYKVHAFVPSIGLSYSF